MAALTLWFGMTAATSLMSHVWRNSRETHFCVRSC